MNEVPFFESDDPIRQIRLIHCCEITVQEILNRLPQLDPRSRRSLILENWDWLVKDFNETGIVLVAISNKTLSSFLPSQLSDDEESEESDNAQDLDEDSPF